VRRAARRPLRPDHHVRRAGHGRIDHLGEPRLGGGAVSDVAAYRSVLIGEDDTEVVTKALVRDVDLPHGAGTMALITLDNGFDHTKPNTFGPRGLLELDAALDAVAARTDLAA